MRNWGTANETPATSRAGQTSFIFRKPQKAQTSQKGTMSEKNGSCRPTMALSWRTSRPVTPARAMIGVPSAPKATGAVLAMSDRPDAASGAKPSPMRMAAVTATGVPKPAAPSKKRAEAEGDEEELQAAVAGDAGQAVLQTLKEPVSTVRVVEEDDVEDDPADGEEAVGGPEPGRPRGHARRGMPKTKDADEQGRLPARGGPPRGPGVGGGPGRRAE